MSGVKGGTRRPQAGLSPRSFILLYCFAGDDAWLPAGQRILGAALCSRRAGPRDTGGRGVPSCGAGGLGVSSGRNPGEGFLLPGWRVGDHGCPCVLLQAWAGDMPGWLFTLAGGCRERLHFWVFKLTCKYDKGGQEDRSVPCKQVC